MATTDLQQPASPAQDQGLPWLVADVGGTNARFGWVTDPTAAAKDVRTLPVASYPGIAEAAKAYLADQAKLLAGDYKAPGKGAFAVATPVTGDAIAFTNSAWSFSRKTVQSDLGLNTLLILNDFEALALSLPRLGPSQWRATGEPPVAQGTLGVVGPGTGMGVGGVVQTPAGWTAISGEGGHATLAAFDDFESELLRHARGQFEHVSAERMLSGIGMPTLHAAVAGVLGLPAEKLTAEDIVERGLAGGDAACSRTIDAFCAMLGGFAGNVALTLGARGGMYIGGGIVPRLGERFFASDFRHRFEAKGRQSAYLKAIPTALITDTLAALTGAALALEQHRN